jgi:hypothetical protein
LADLRIQLRSPPAQKLLPLPRSTTARTVLSAPAFCTSAVSSSITASLKALCTSGRLRVMVAILFSVL